MVENFVLSSTNLQRNKSDLKIRNKSPLLTARYRFESTPYSTKRETSSHNSKHGVTNIESSALLPPTFPPPRVSSNKSANKDLNECMGGRREKEERKPSSFRKYKIIQKRRPNPPPIRPPYSLPLTDEASSMHSSRSQKSIIVYSQDKKAQKPHSRAHLNQKQVTKIKREQLKFGLDNLDFTDLDSAFQALKSFVDHCKDVSDHYTQEDQSPKNEIESVQEDLYGSQTDRVGKAYSRPQRIWSGAKMHFK